MHKIAVYHCSFALVALAFFLGGASIAAAGKTPSKRQCTCIIAKQPQLTGAWAVNATACIRVDVGPWCDIHLVAIENAPPPAVVVGAIVAPLSESDLGDFDDMLFDLLDQYAVSAQVWLDGTEQAQFAEDIESLKKDIEWFSSGVVDCVTKFQAGETIEIEEGDFSCSVGAESHWLQLSFDQNGKEYSFLFSPRFLQ